jgi:predicted phosphoribosyltransferase
MGAIASGGVKVMNESAVRRSGISEQRIEDIVQKEKVTPSSRGI